MTYSSKVTLYVVQNNETVDSIAKKFNINSQDIIRLNPILKYSTLHAGQPINILVPDIQIPTNSEQKRQNLDCPQIFATHVGLIKQLIISEIFVPNYSITTNTSLKESNDAIILCIEQTHQTANIYNYKILIEEMQNELLTFISIVKSKYSSALLKFNKHVDNLIANFAQLGILPFKGETDSALEMKTTMKMWQMFVLKLIANKFDDAEKIYKDLEKQYIEIAKKL